MTVIGSGTIGGQYAGVSDFKGESEVAMLIVSIETLEGLATFLIQKTVWNKHFDTLEKGQNVVVQYSVLEHKKDTIYVLERIVGLTDE